MCAMKEPISTVHVTVRHVYVVILTSRVVDLAIPVAPRNLK